MPVSPTPDIMTKPSFPCSVEGRHAFVCGASRGIGRATAEVLSRLGAEVTVVARDASALDDTVAALSTEHGQSHRALSLDFGDTEQLLSTLRDYLADAPSPEILVNNSGGPAAGAILDAAPEAFLNGFRQHLIANQTLVQAFLPGMKESAYGRIINIISTSVREPIPGLGVSNTIRGAVASWAKTVSREVAAFGVTINNVLPGFTHTERLRTLFETRAKSSGRSFDEIEESTLAQVPMGRFAEPEEIAYAIAFLASPAAAYISGVSLPIDGARLHGI